MIYLPRLHLGVARYRLPLSGRGAERLALALLKDQQECQIADIAELLRTEPGLALWSICRAGRWQIEPPRDLAVVAGWFAVQGIDALQWSQEELHADRSIDDGLIDCWAEFAADSVTNALCAAGLADDDRREPAYLGGLLSGAPKWLEQCEPIPDAVSGNELPVWLAAAEALRAEASPANEAEPDKAHVPDGAADPCPAASISRSCPADPALVATPPDAVAAIRGRWRDRENEWARLLPGLVSKLRRLCQLETDFQTTLEGEKLEALKELAYGASHEINNPLANISTRAQTLMREEPDPERRRKLAVINAQAFRAHEMISDMMLFARPPVLERQAVDLTALVDRVIREVREDAAVQGTTVERISANLPLTISADPTHLAVALKAICTNSLEALRAGGRVEIAVRPPDTASGLGGAGYADIVVTDNGPGISPEVRRHLFDPYFSGREAGRGLGLGLSKCWRIVTEHGGRIDVDSWPHRETTFTIRLPIEAPVNIPAAEH